MEAHRAVIPTKISSVSVSMKEENYFPLFQQIDDTANKMDNVHRKWSVWNGILWEGDAINSHTHHAK